VIQCGEGRLKSHVISRPKATQYRALLREMTYTDKASYKVVIRTCAKPVHIYTGYRRYMVSLVGRIDKIIGLFRKRAP